MASSASRNTANIYNKERILDFEKIEPARFIWSYGPTAPSPLWPMAPTAALNSLTSKHYSGILVSGHAPREPRSPAQVTLRHSRGQRVSPALALSAHFTRAPSGLSTCLAHLVWLCHVHSSMNSRCPKVSPTRSTPSQTLPFPSIPSAPPSGRPPAPAPGPSPPRRPERRQGRAWLE